jgi:hypothetical protein
MINEKRLK